MKTNPLDSPLKIARKAEGLSQAALAKNVGISQPSLSEMERGEISPSLDTAEKLVVALNKRVTELHLLYPKRYMTGASSDKQH